ncbi:MAG: hypothetical protein WAU13_13075 [Albidovulum sp.]
MGQRPSIAYVIDPRFPGGTSSAVAQELRVSSRMANVTVHAVSSNMFSGTDIAPQLKTALADLGLNVIWDQPTIAADTIIIHNPSFLKFQKKWEVKIIARHVIVVTHENFLRPSQIQAFDVASCLDLIDRSALALRKTIAPISAYNRQTVGDWLALNPTCQWNILTQDWFNICDFPVQVPNPSPADRRGRHSRPGFEKFPGLADMDHCFPDHAVCNIILGGDTYISDGLLRPHWDIHPFRAIEVADFFAMIDFMVYFTAPTWRESFGRVLAEAIATGKVVISDAGTASTFGGAVIAATPLEVDEIIAHFIAHPLEYKKHILKAQTRLADFSAEAFGRMLHGVLNTQVGVAA